MKGTSIVGNRGTKTRNEQKKSSKVKERNKNEKNNKGIRDELCEASATL